MIGQTLCPSFSARSLLAVYGVVNNVQHTQQKLSSCIENVRRICKISAVIMFSVRRLNLNDE